MGIRYINSYTYIETDFKNGLDNIGSVLAPLYPDQTIQSLADAVYNYTITTYMAGDEPNPLQARSLKSAIYAIINGYINIGNGDTLELNSLQSSFAFELVNGTLELRNPEDIKQHIIDIEERITASPLSVNEQVPLLYATAIGKASYDYWANTIANLTPANPWINFINSFTPPIVKFPTWIASAMQGTLIGLSMYQNRINGSLAAELRLVLEYVGANTLLSLFGSLGVGVGKVVFNYSPNPTTSFFSRLSHETSSSPSLVRYVVNIRIVWGRYRGPDFGCEPVWGLCGFDVVVGAIKTNESDATIELVKGKLSVELSETNAPSKYLENLIQGHIVIPNNITVNKDICYKLGINEYTIFAGTYKIQRCCNKFHFEF